MTKKLEQLLELAESEENELTVPLPDMTEQVTSTALTNLEKIEEALPIVRGLEASDYELDNLAEMATNSFKDLQDLGLQVESRFSSEILAVAGTMLGHAITAKTAKINKKLKMIELQLKKANLDSKLHTKDEEVSNIPIGEGRSLDRNELLKILNGKNNEQ